MRHKNDKTHCIKGHRLIGSNIAYKRDYYGKRRRCCRLCRNEAARNYYHKNRPVSELDKLRSKISLVKEAIRNACDEDYMMSKYRGWKFEDSYIDHFKKTLKELEK